MDCPQVLKPFPVSRFINYTDFRLYYAYGNTPAENLLESLAGTEIPSVLLLGCGDIRSCFYTLWKNFDAAHKSSFNGVKFVLADYSAAVLARNILFLYLCLQKPTREDAVKKWLAALWAIWFCHELSQDHVSVLNDALIKLRNWSSSLQAWSESKQNPLHNIVKFENEDTLREVTLMWKHWHEESTERPGVHAMKKARKSLREGERVDLDWVKKKARSDIVHYPNLRNDKQQILHQIMCQESDSYVKTGTVFAESVLGVSLPSKQTSVNVTMYERMDWMYTMASAAVPWKCFTTPSYSISKKQMERNGVSKAILDQIVVPDRSFESSPLLANCMQFFSLWLISSSTILANTCSEQTPPIAFTFVFSDALEFCQSQIANAKNPVFDFIHASNLIDYVSPLNLVLLTLPLLKTSGYLLTGTMHYGDLSSNRSTPPCTHLFLERCFGFKPHLLPLVCGVRCINHEDKYSSPLSIQLESPFSKTELKCLIWQKTTAPSLKMPSLEKCSAVLNALCNSICTAVLSYFHKKKGIHTLAPLCAGSAMMILQSFVDQIDGSLKPLHFSFWEPLCSLLKHDGRLKPHLVSLQAQALLHALHLHLILSESECPICQGKPFTSFLSQFTVSLNLPLCRDFYKKLPYSSPCVVVYIHKLKYYKSNRYTDDDDMHIIDSTGGSIDSSNDMLNLNFFAPSSFAEDGYSMAAEVSYLVSNQTMEYSPLYALQGKLSACRAPKTTYIVCNTNPSLPSTSATLGVIDQHIGTGEEFHTSISLSNTAVAALAETGTSLSIKQISDSQLEILCGKYSLSIRYPYPVDHNSGEICQTQTRVHVKVARRPHFFHEENPYYIVDPDNRFMFILLKNKEVQDYSAAKALNTCNLQLGETISLWSNAVVKMSYHSTESSLENAIDIIIFYSEVNTFQIHTDALKGLIVVQDHLFDFHKQTAVVDINYCLSDEVSLEGTATMQKNIYMNEKEFGLLKKTLAYFAKCTKTSSLSGKMRKSDFKRAVVYPLCRAKDIGKMAVSQSACSQTHAAFGTKCSYCDSLINEVLQCGKCLKAYYCNVTCQRNHWRKHRQACKATLEPEQCGCCGKETLSLKKCPCHLVAYCNQQCQRKDWSQHKHICSSKK